MHENPTDFSFLRCFANPFATLLTNVLVGGRHRCGIIYVCDSDAGCLVANRGAQLVDIVGRSAVAAGKGLVVVSRSAVAAGKGRVGTTRPRCCDFIASFTPRDLAMLRDAEAVVQDKRPPSWGSWVVRRAAAAAARSGERRTAAMMPCVRACVRACVLVVFMKVVVVGC